MAVSTSTSRRIVVENPDGAYLTHIRDIAHGVLPLTNPGHFAAGVYRGLVHVVEGTATITKEEA
jgi:hypothetical protein